MLESNYTTDEELKKLKEKLALKTKQDAQLENNDIKIDLPTPKEEPKITGGLYESKTAPVVDDKSVVEVTTDKTTDTDENAKKSNGKTGEKIAAGVSGAASMASIIAAKKGPMTKKERTANTLNLAATGASTGMAVAGPWGALALAAIGAGAGLIMGRGDQKKLDRKLMEVEIEKNNNIRQDRFDAQKLEDGEKRVADRKRILQSQAGMLGSKYLNSKIG